MPKPDVKESRRAIQNDYGPVIDLRQQSSCSNRGTRTFTFYTTHKDEGDIYYIATVDMNLNITEDFCSGSKKEWKKAKRPLFNSLTALDNETIRTDILPLPRTSKFARNANVAMQPPQSPGSHLPQAQSGLAALHPETTFH